MIADSEARLMLAIARHYRSAAKYAQHVNDVTYTPAHYSHVGNYAAQPLDNGRMPMPWYGARADLRDAIILDSI